MRTVVRIDGLASGVRIPGGGDTNGISRDLLEKLCAIYPEGRRGVQGHSFCSYLDLDDPRTRDILQLLERAGMQRWKGRGDKRDNEYLFVLQRVYDEADLDACELLEIHIPYGENIKGVWRRPVDPALVLKEPSTKWDIVSVFRPYCYAVIDRAKRVLEASGLCNLTFRPAEKAYDSVDYDLYDEEDTWWELRSDLILPPLSSSMTLVHKDGTPFTGDFSKGCGPREGSYMHPELHYRREDIERAGLFDLAHTYEMFGGLPNEYDRPLIASKRFYQICKQHNIRTGWVPVRIDE